MSDSQAFALLADPNKVDVSTKPTVQEEIPFNDQRPPTPRPSEPVSGMGSSSSSSGNTGGGNIINLLEETKEMPFNTKPTGTTTVPSATSESESKGSVLDLSNIQINDSKPEPPPQLTPEQIREKKERILYDIERLRRRGVRFPRSFTMASDLDEMEGEYNRIKKDLETEQAVRFQRKMLMTCVSGIEMLNSRFDPFDVQLDGWSESVNENIGDYDDVFEELYDKYRGSGKMAPELRLLFMLGGSALMFHMTKSMFSSATPQVADILRSNPGLASQMQQAAAQQMASNMGGGGAAGGGGGGFASMMGLASGGSSGVNKASPPPPRGVVVPPPENVDDVLAELQGSSAPKSSGKKSSKSRSSGGKRGGGIDTISLSLNH